MSALPFTDADYDLLAEDFEAYSASALMIRTKAGRIEPFELNSSQRFAHERIEQQRYETG